MEALLGLIGGFLNGIRAMVGLVLPIFADAADFRRWPGWLKFLIGLALVGGICYGLYELQKQFDLGFYLIKHVPPKLQKVYLPVLFLLLVAFSWLAFGLWKLLTADPEAAEFEDMRSEWAEITRRLAASRMTVGDAPLFLVIGRPSAGLDALFLAAGIKDIIRTPNQGEPAIRVYAWQEAIFVVCPGASAWARYCTELADPGADTFGADPSSGAPAGATIGAGGWTSGGDPVLEAELKDLVSESGRRDLVPHEQARLRELSDLLAAVPTVVRKIVIPEDDRVKMNRRFRYLCKLIRKARRPWCPLNGVLVLVPWAATETDDAARLGCGILERELDSAREIFQLRYPTFGLVCDLETAHGFTEFRQGFRADMLKQRIGQRVPLVPVGPPDEVKGLVGSAARWIGLAVLPSWILRFLKLDVPNPDARRSGGATNPTNRNLYLLQRAVFERGPRLAELLARGIPPVGGGDDLADVPMFGGCYLAATGKDGKTQAFVEGVFQRVMESQNAVSWTPEAEAEDRRLGRLVMMGYVMTFLLLLAGVAAGYWLWTMSKATTT